MAQRKPQRFSVHGGAKIGDWLILSHGPPNRHGAPRMFCRCERCGTERLVLRYSLTSGKSQGCGCLRHVLMHEASLAHGEALQVGDTPAYGRWQTMRKWFRREALEMPDWLATFEAFREATPTVPVGFQLQRPDRSRPWALDNMEPVPIRHATSRKSLWAYHAARRPGEVEARREYRRKRREAKRAAGQGAAAGGA